MKLSEPKSKEEFLKESQSQTVNSLSADSLTSLWSTVTLLAQSSSNTEQLSFVFPSLCVAPSISASSISKDQGGFIGELVRAAHATSNATASSSLLAGRSSESDEYGDVGLLLPFVEGNDRERKVLEILGLQGCIEDGGEVTSLDLDNNLPAGVPLIAGVASLDHLTSLCSKLENPFEFRLQGNSSIVIWVFLGKLSIGGEPHLAGLLGAGTWT